MHAGRTWMSLLTLDDDFGEVRGALVQPHPHGRLQLASKRRPRQGGVGDRLETVIAARASHRVRSQATHPREPRAARRVPHMPFASRMQRPRLSASKASSLREPTALPLTSALFLSAGSGERKFEPLSPVRAALIRPEQRRGLQLVRKHRGSEDQHKFEPVLEREYELTHPWPKGS